MNPFIIAEMSANHNGSLETAYGIVEAAAYAGANAIKLQTYDPARMAIPGYTIKTGAWKGYDLRTLYSEAKTPYAWHEELFKKAIELGLIPMSSPFSHVDVEFLEGIGCPLYKIASFEIIDLELIRVVARTGKPMIMSTGMASLQEIEIAVATAEEAGCDDITLLHCVSEYPTPIESVNLRTMKDMEGFGWKVGLSDHTTSTAVAVAAVAMGAEVIEKHLRLGNIGLDSDFSLNPTDFKHMVDDCRTAALAMGRVTYQGGDTELRRSLYYSHDIQSGTIIAGSDIKTSRPALGLNPIDINDVIGKTLPVDVKANDPVRMI